jgi:hypothetical protein
MARTWGGILKWYDGDSWEEVYTHNFKVYTNQWLTIDPSHFKIYYPESNDTSAGWYPIRMAQYDLVSDCSVWFKNDQWRTGTRLLNEVFPTLEVGGSYKATIVSGGIIGNCVDNSAGTGMIATGTSFWNTFDHAVDTYSLSCWIKLDVLASTQGGSRRYISGGTMGSSPWQNTRWYINPTTNKIVFEQYNTSSIRFNAYGDTALTSTGTWYHVGVTISAGEPIKLYLNGIDDTADSSTFTGTFLSGNSGLHFGDGYYAGNQGFDGKIDEIGIWTDVLTEGEMFYLYNNGIGRTYPFT